MRNDFRAGEDNAEIAFGGLGERDAQGVSPAPVLPMPKPVSDGVVTAGEIAYRAGDVRDLRAEVDRLRAERDRLLATQRTVMDLVHATNADRLIHDLRNLLNERELYKALANSIVEEPER